MKFSYQIYIVISLSISSIIASAERDTDSTILIPHTQAMADSIVGDVLHTIGATLFNLKEQLAAVPDSVTISAVLTALQTPGELSTNSRYILYRLLVDAKAVSHVAGLEQLGRGLENPQVRNICLKAMLTTSAIDSASVRIILLNFVKSHFEDSNFYRMSINLTFRGLVIYEAKSEDAKSTLSNICTRPDIDPIVQSHAANSLIDLFGFEALGEIVDVSSGEQLLTMVRVFQVYSARNRYRFLADAAERDAFVTQMRLFSTKLPDSQLVWYADWGTREMDIIVAKRPNDAGEIIREWLSILKIISPRANDPDSSERIENQRTMLREKYNDLIDGAE